MYVLIRHKVSDFVRWKQAYDKQQSRRAGLGVEERFLFRNRDDRQEVVILFEAENADAVRTLFDSELRETGEAAGVMAQTALFLDEIEEPGPGSEALKDELEELRPIEEETLGSRGGLTAVEFVFLAPEAREVHLTGSFNDWDRSSLPMKRNRRGQWKISLQLAPGRYEYRYVVDGSWVTDKKCSRVAAGEMGAPTCIIDVAQKRAA